MVIIKHLHAVQFDGITFGIEVEATTEAYRNFKKAVKLEKCIGVFGTEIEIFVVPYRELGAIMREAHWLVTERKSFNSIHIDGLCGEDIYVRYTDEPIDFRNRTAQISQKNRPPEQQLRTVVNIKNI